MTDNKYHDEFTIDRSEWLPHEVQEALGIESELLHNTSTEERMCCLGVYLRHLGVPSDELAGVDLPSNVVSLPKAARWLVAGGEKDIGVEEEFAIANDSPMKSLSVREHEITELFAAQGIKVTFVGELGIGEGEGR